MFEKRVRPEDLKKGMQCGMDKKIYYTVLEDAVVEGELVSAKIEWADGGIDRRKWSMTDNTTIPLFNDEAHAAAKATVLPPA